MKARHPFIALLLLATPALADADMQQAKMDFGHLCAPCHGRDGKGEGTQAARLDKKPSDLTVVTQKYGEFPAQKVFETIAGLDMPDGHGTRDMPIWGDVFVTEEVGKSTTIEQALKASDEASRRITALVHYVEAIQVAP
jgi:hypothetical protein